VFALDNEPSLLYLPPGSDPISHSGSLWTLFLGTGARGWKGNGGVTSAPLFLQHGLLNLETGWAQKATGEEV
jgi:hypothetical protein